MAGDPGRSARATRVITAAHLSPITMVVTRQTHYNETKSSLQFAAKAGGVVVGPAQRNSVAHAEADKPASANKRAKK